MTSLGEHACAWPSLWMAAVRGCVSCRARYSVTLGMPWVEVDMHHACCFFCCSGRVAVVGCYGQVPVVDDVWRFALRVKLRGQLKLLLC